MISNYPLEKGDLTNPMAPIGLSLAGMSALGAPSRS